MISPAILIPGDVVAYNHQKTEEFGVGLFIRIVKWKTSSDKGIDMIVLNSLGVKTNINEQDVEWDVTELMNECGVAS